jgi:hypothetical protein
VPFSDLGSLHYPHNSNPRPANAAALLRQELEASSAAGALDADSSGSDANAELVLVFNVDCHIVIQVNPRSEVIYTVSFSSTKE